MIKTKTRFTLLRNIFNLQPISFSINRFSSIKTVEQQTDQLKKYESYLLKHNESLKKPHDKLRTQEIKVINKYLQSQRLSQVISFLTRNSNKRLCNIQTASIVDQHLVKNYQKVSNSDKNLAAFALSSFRQTKFFNLFKESFEIKLKTQGIQKCTYEQIVSYLYGMIIVNKNIDFLKKIYSKQSIKDNFVFDKAYQIMFYHKQRSPLYNEAKLVLQYFQLLMNPKLNKIQKETYPIHKKRSLLQIEVESYLSILKQKYEREMTVNGFATDFIIERYLNNETKKYIIQVNGNYHYTLGGKLKGRQVVRGVIINQCLPLRIVHYNDFLLSKGNRNKMAYIQMLLNQKKSVNWEATNQGFNSNWQLQDMGDLLKQ